MRFFITLLIWWGLANAARAQFETLLVPPAEAVPAGRTLRLTLYLNNPSTVPATFKLPPDLRATLASPTEQRTLAVTPVDVVVDTEIVIEPMGFRAVALTVILPDTLAGNASLRLLGLSANPIMFAVSPAKKVPLNPGTVKAAEAASADRPRDLNQASAFEQMRSHLLPYEPIYFALGFNDGLNGRFQFSFKFRVLAPLGNTSDLLRDIYFGYTQTSLWDLQGESKPFHDTSYKPTIFYYRESPGWKPDWIGRLGLQVGAQHESNGQAVKVSRSLNTFYAMPTASWVKWRTWEFSVAPRVITYLEKSENADLPRYRGYVEWLLSAEQGKDFKFTAYLRKGTGLSFGSMELFVKSFPGLDGYLSLLNRRAGILIFFDTGDNRSTTPGACKPFVDLIL